MQTKLEKSSSKNSTSASDSQREGASYAEIVSLARKSVSPIQFLQSCLKVIAKHFVCPYAAMHVRYASEVIQDDWHAGPTDPKFWKNSLQQFLTESLAEPTSRAKLLKSKTGATKVAFLSATVFDSSGPAIGAVALVIAPTNEAKLGRQLDQLESLARLMSFSAEFLGRSQPTASANSPGGRASGSQTDHRTLSRAASFTTVEELAFALTNDLCTKAQCEQVALGLVQGKRIRIISISGFDNVKSQSPGVSAIRGAMEECLDASALITYQRGTDWATDEKLSGYRLHKQWHSASHGDAVASMPLAVDGHTIAVLSLRRPASDPFKPGQLDDIKSKVEPYAPALELTRRASRSFLTHATDGIKRFATLVRHPDRVGLKVMVAVALLMTASFFFGSMNYELTVPCVVTPHQLRQLTMPFDGLVESASIVEGEVVQAGQVLCLLNHKELDQQQVELQAELAVLERETDRALASNLPIDVQLARAKQVLTQAKLDIVTRRIAQATVRSPIAGVVVTGDLRQRIGGVVARGETLFAVAPLDHWTLEVQVPEHSSADLHEKLTGRFAAFAKPELSTPFSMSRVLGEAQIRNGINVYIAEADVVAEQDWLRPGMEGVAKLELGSRRVWWITLHRAIDYIRLHLWP